MVHLSSSILLLAFMSAVSAQGNSGGQLQEGDQCTCRYGTEDGFGGVFHYFESPNNGGKCTGQGDLICVTEDDDGTFGVDFNGVCQSASCFASLNDNVGKVTICHRTCSENNPWVRITVDSSAWVGGHCGHSLEECNNVDTSAWGAYQQDYILKNHGTRAQVAAMLNNDAEAIAAYWRAWEPACPAVRNGNCCDFDTEYGYTCCGRALEDPPYDPIVNEVTLMPTESPIAEQIQATDPPTAIAELPQIVSTDAPTASPVLSQTQATEPPVEAQILTTEPPSSETIVDPPDCFNRRLQDMQDRWDITLPSFNYQRSLSFHMDFEISDFVTDNSMISYTVMDKTCTNSYSGSGLLDTPGLRIPSATSTVPGVSKQLVGLAFWIDPTEIAADSEIYSEGLDANDEMKGNVDYCVRFSLSTPSSTDGGSQEVNYLEVVVNFDADLTDGFTIGTLQAAAKDRCEAEAQEAFEVEGYFCEDGTEDSPILTRPVLNQGDLAKVCVRPVPRALNLGVRMRNIAEFTFRLNDSGIEQKAIENALPASNGLTEVTCEPGYAICYFESLLFAAFFATPGFVLGSGVADLQFGGQQSIVSVSPSKRNLREESTTFEGNPPRFLQEGAPEDGASSVAFDLEFDVAESTFSYNDGSGSASRMNVMQLLFVSGMMGFLVSNLINS